MDVITRTAALLIAILLAIDAFGGGRSETLRVERHSSVLHWHHGDEYRLHFSGGRVDTCRVDRAAFDALGDGDLVSVGSSRVFKTCDTLRRGDELVTQSPLRKWLLVVPMLCLLAAALGWIQFEGRVGGGRRQRDWWFGQ
jgi:hypothetical protein